MHMFLWPARALAFLTSTGPQLVSGLARRVTGVPAATGDRCAGYYSVFSDFDLYRSAARQYFRNTLAFLNHRRYWICTRLFKYALVNGVSFISH